MMASLSWASPIHSSLSEHHFLPPPLPRLGIDTNPHPHPLKNDRTNRSLPRRRKQDKIQEQQKPTVIQLERALQQSRFRGGGAEEVNIGWDTADRFWEDESPAEKKLREMGEWIISRTETGSPSAGKNVLLGMFLWILLTWTVLLLVASGLIKLPFSRPFLGRFAYVKKHAFTGLSAGSPVP